MGAAGDQLHLQQGQTAGDGDGLVPGLHFLGTRLLFFHDLHDAAVRVLEQIAAQSGIRRHRTAEGDAEVGLFHFAVLDGCKEQLLGFRGLGNDDKAAGTAQAYMNLYNRMPGKEVVILGSGDIGMIMARRMTLEGAHVQAVFELMPYPSGLPRNIVQCLDDYNIPLYLSHTVTEIHGRDRLTGVTISEVDANRRPIPGTEKEYKCDTLILSVGLIPENKLLEDAGIAIDPHTNGAVVDENLQTNVPGVFSAGNVLHVHDLVDFVSMESEALARHAAAYVEGKGIDPCTLDVKCGEGVGHTIPQKVSGKNDFSLSLRVRNHYRDCRIVVRQNGVEVAAKKMKKAIPAEMIQFKVSAAKLQETGALEVSVE